MTTMSAGAVRLRLDEILKNRGLKQKDLAALAGLHENTVSRLVSGGVRQIDMETIGKLCDALGITPEQLFDYSPEGKDGSS